METSNRKRNRSLNRNLNENLNGNLNGNPIGKLNGNWGKPDGNLNEHNLGPNWDQQASLGVLGRSFGEPWVVLGRSLEGPWRLLVVPTVRERSIQVATKLGPKERP